MRHAAGSGALLLSATASRTEGELQAGLIEQFLQSGDLPAEVTERVRRLITSGLLTDEEPAADPRSAHPQGTHALHEAGGVLLELARSRPLVVAVDDVHFTDAASLQLLLYLLRRLRSSRMMMLLTEWDHPQLTLPQLRAELSRCPHRELRIGPMSREATARTVEQSLGRDPGAGAVSAFHRLSGGNPMLLKALVEDHRQACAEQPAGAGREEATPVAGVAFGQATVASLHGWEPELPEIARGIAVLGDHADPELIGRLTGLHTDVVNRALGVLGHAGLLLQGRFRHPGAESAVLGTLPPAERPALHRRAAELLYAHGASALAVALQLLGAGDPAEAWTIPVLRAAAEQALADDDPPLAVRCLEAALESSAEEAERLSITAALARATWLVNPAAAAPYIPVLKKALFARSLPAREAMRVVRYLLWNGEIQDVAEILRTRSDCQGLDDSRPVVELRLSYQWYFNSERGHFDAAKETVCAGGGPWGRAADRLTAVWNHKESNAAVDSAEQILQSCRLEDSAPEVIAAAVQVLISGNRLKRASWWCDRLLEESERRGTVTPRMLLSSLRAGIALRRGKLPAAMAEAEEALSVLPPQSWGVLIGHPLATLISACTAMGRHDAAARAVQVPVPAGMLDTIHGLRYLYARGIHYLATDRVLAAISDFQRCGWLMREWSVDVPSLVPWRSSLAEAHLRLGSTTVAREMVNQQLQMTRAADDRIMGISLRVLAESSELAQRPSLMRRAVRHLESAGDHFELARTLEALSRVHQELEEFDQARLLARRAAQENKACHSGTTASARGSAGGRRVEVAPAEPSRAPAPSAPRGGPVERPEWPALSDAQRRVADLAALGHTNQEISRRLYITVSTVEQHLTRVFRKLGVNGRNDLPVGMSDVS